MPLKGRKPEWQAGNRSVQFSSVGFCSLLFCLCCFPPSPTTTCTSTHNNHNCSSGVLNPVPSCDPDTGRPSGLHIDALLRASVSDVAAHLLNSASPKAAGVFLMPPGGTDRKGSKAKRSESVFLELTNLEKYESNSELCWCWCWLCCT